MRRPKAAKRPERMTRSFAGETREVPERFGLEVVRPSLLRRVLRRLDFELWRKYIVWTNSPLRDSDLYRKEWLLLRRALLQPSVRRYLEVGVFKLGCFRAAGEILKKKAGSQMVGVDLFDLGHLSRSLTTVNQTHIGGSVDYEAALRLMVPYPFAELIRADSSGALRPWPSNWYRGPVN